MGSGTPDLKQPIEGVFLYKVFAGKGRRPFLRIGKVPVFQPPGCVKSGIK